MSESNGVEDAEINVDGGEVEELEEKAEQPSAGGEIGNVTEAVTDPLREQKDPQSDES